jgi:hypothetical protein
MKRWKVWLGVAIIFVSGLVIGSLGTGVVVGLSVKRLVHRVSVGDTSIITRMVMIKMRRDLRLRRSQRRQIRPLVAAVVERISRLHQALRPKIEQEIARAVIAINRYLTPRQQRRFKERLERLRHRWHPGGPATLSPPISP